jgi:hypothetical protein
VTYTTEEFVRRAIVGILRKDKYRGRFVCLTCLVTMTLECLYPGWRKSEIARAVDKVYAAPGIPPGIRAVPRGSVSVTPPIWLDERGGSLPTVFLV